YPIPVLKTKDDQWLEAQGRLAHPFYKSAGSVRYEAIGWEDAFKLIGSRLQDTSPDRAVFYTSGRTSNEAAFLYQLLARQYGTNNLPDCSNMCHESSGKGLSEVIGVGKGTVSLDDFDQADMILVIGQNPGTNHPRMLTALQNAAERGCNVVSINPLKEPGLFRFKHPQRVGDLLGSGTALARHHLQVTINGDVALLQGLAKALFELEAKAAGSVLDHAFIHSHTDGFEPYREAIKRVSWSDITTSSGITQEQIREVAADYAASDRVIACWAMGLTQHQNGVANIQEVVNLMLLRGNLGKPGAGLCPVRGHSNVQGDRTMGIWEAPPEGFLTRLDSCFQMSAPRKHGFNTVQTIQAMYSGEVDVFIGLGGNFVAAAPDTQYTARAMSRCGLTVQISTKLNRSHLETGNEALILPCLARSERDIRQGREQFVTVENSMSIVHRSSGHLPPCAPTLLSEPAIVSHMACAALGSKAGGAESPRDWETFRNDYDTIRDAISLVVDGFEDFNLRIRDPGWFVLPNAARQREFRTTSGKAEFSVHAIPARSIPEGHLLMMTIRSHDQYNTTVYSHNDRYRGVFNDRRVVLMHENDIVELGLSPGARVDLFNELDGRERIVRSFTVVPYDIPRGCVATYFPEANPLVPVERYAAKSFTPISKSVPVLVRPAGQRSTAQSPEKSSSLGSRTHGPGSKSRVREWLSTSMNARRGISRAPKRSVCWL
ncbi:MAG: FdhF/YdeP family oxidoreductase, partial [Myxococcales bacterium]|nr:FdhF/YdeP family oxidoreductase [Myxococcales bacterium]